MQTFLQDYGEQLQYFLFVFCFVLLLVLERFFPRRHQNKNRLKRWLTNAGMTISVFLFVSLLPISFAMVSIWTVENGVGLMNNLPFVLPVTLVVLLTLLLRSLIVYLTHRLNHCVPLFWRFHRVHHMDTELDVSSAVRFHPLEMVISLSIGLPLFLLLGLNPWVLLLYEIVDTVIVLFSHSNLKLNVSVNRVLRYFIVTPDLHKVHHSSFQPETDSNYSAVFPIWDLLFGTFRTETHDPVESMRLGNDQTTDDQAQEFLWLLKSPFINMPRSVS